MGDPTFGFGGFGDMVGGMPSFILNPFEDRQIVVGAGIEAHDEDVPDSLRIFDYLSDSSRLGSDFNRISDTEAEYTSTVQQVHFSIRIVHTKREFREALQTPDLHVIYDGHSRYGRGACFHPYTGQAPGSGEMWEQGTDDNNGIFRMGYPYVPVSVIDMSIRPDPMTSLNDLHKHGPYTFRPVSGDDPAPPRDDRHPDARRPLSRIHMPAAIRPNVESGFESSDHRYWGLEIRGETHFLLVADWQVTQSDPFDLGGTDLNCKTFCHFGCSSRLHYREIVRGEGFKAWIRPDPPVDHYAYFTTAPSNARCTPFWLHALLTYNQENSNQRWFESLENTKTRTNRMLARVGERYSVF